MHLKLVCVPKMYVFSLELGLAKTMILKGWMACGVALGVIVVLFFVFFSLPQVWLLHPDLTAIAPQRP